MNTSGVQRTALRTSVSKLLYTIKLPRCHMNRPRVLAGPLWFCAILTVLLISAPQVHSEIPYLISFQGRITDSTGVLPESDYLLTFRIYDAAVGGTVLWSSGAQLKHVSNGLFTHQLGSAVPLPVDLFDSDSVRYLGVQVEADPELTPRTQMISTPYAFHAHSADLAYSGELFRLIPVPVPPACDTTGRGIVYYDSSLNELCFCNGSGWFQVDGGGACECVDADGDGFDGCDPGDPKDTDGMVADCDDTDPSTYPGAFDIPCDGIDQDCDGFDAGSQDLDGDGFAVCGDTPDCDDADASIYPGAPDPACDGIDQDCDGFDSGGIDADADGFTVCDGDCDDTDASVYPGAPEICDGKDNDCNTIIDDGCI